MRKTIAIAVALMGIACAASGRASVREDLTAAPSSGLRGSRTPQMAGALVSNGIHLNGVQGNGLRPGFDVRALALKPLVVPE